MRFILLWLISATVPMFLLRLLLEPLTGVSNAAFLAAGVVIASNLLWIEYCRIRDWFETDRLVYAAQLTNIVVLVSLTSTIAHLLVNTQAAAPAWQHMIAYPVVFAIVSLLLVTIALLLCRFSFSAAEMRDAERRRREATQRPAPART